MKSWGIVSKELKKQREKYGFEHDIVEHGSKSLAEIAGLLISPTPPDREIYEDQWFVSLYEKHCDNPVKRYAIASAMLCSAIDCKMYEYGAERSSS